MRMPVVLLLLVFAVAALPTAPAQPPQPPMPPDMPPPFLTEVETLITSAQSPDIQVSAPAILRLRELGPAAVPALTRGLWSDSATTRRNCAELLGSLSGDARAAAPSLARLVTDDSNTEVRAQAARSLALLSAYSAIPALTKTLKDESAVVRLTAADALIRLGADADVVLPVLSKSLKSQRVEEQEAAAKLLGDLGPEAAPALLALQEALGEADPLFAARVAETLGRIGPEAKNALPILKQKLTDDRAAAVFRVHGAIALWRINRDPDAPNLLRTSLEDKKPVGLRPHMALWRIDPSQETVDALTKQLKSEEPREVLLVAEVLGKRSKDTIPALVAMLKKENEKEANKLHAMLLLGGIGTEAKREALDPLTAIATMKSGYLSFYATVTRYQIDPTPDNAMAVAAYLENKDYRLQAAEALMRLRPTGKAVAIELLVAVDSTDDELRLTAALALWRIEKNASALKAAVKSLRAPDARVRELAALEIGALFGADAKPAVPDLVKRLFDSHAGVRSNTAEALGRIGAAAKDATPALVTLLEGYEPAFVQSAACEALGLIEPTEKDVAVAVLKTKLEHPAPLVRAHAALALARVAGDKSGEQEAVRGLGHRTHPVRITAAETLWKLSKDARAVPLLVRTLEEANLSGQEGENERYMAARALGRIGADAKPAVPELLKMLESRDEALAATARAALKAIDPDTAKNAGVK